MNHLITICTSCWHKGTGCRPGYELIECIRHIIAEAGDAVPEEFKKSAVAWMAGCDHPCTVAHHGTRKPTYLFGDIDPETDITDLVTFGRQYAHLCDGWCSSVDPSGKLCKSTLARVPAAITAIEDDEALAS